MATSSLDHLGNHHVEDTFTGAGGLAIYWQAWLPADAPKAIVLVAHGYGEHSGRYGNVVSALVPQGFAVYAPDHRGHGKSGGHRALIDRHQYLLDDLHQVFTIATAKHPNTPVFLLGHSMGGNIALAYALVHQRQLQGLILSGPAITTHGIPSALQKVAKAIGRIAPKAPTQKLSSAGVSRDPEVVRAYDNDPLVFHGKMPAGTGASIVATSEAFPGRLPSLTIPLLVVHGSADKVVSVESGRTAHERAGSKDKTLKIYPGLAHEVFNEPEHPEVLADVVAWLNNHLT